MRPSAITPWPHQVRGVNETLATIENGDRRVLLTAPTGAGKTYMMCELIRRWQERDYKVAVYTHRKLLLEQTGGVLDLEGIKHGVRAAGHSGDRYRSVQLCSIQTEHRRVTSGGGWGLHAADAVLVDEAHLLGGDSARHIMQSHYENGAAIVGVTATPLGLGGQYDALVQAGTQSELRACGALVAARHYGCDEPDTTKIRKQLWEYTENDVRKAMMVPGLFGRILEWWETLNPEQLPTILFAPGVPESLFLCEQFLEADVRAAHIDGQEVWLDGRMHRSDPAMRSRVLEMSRTGEIKVLCNRFVLREGIDAPWLRHGIFATVLGGLGTYLQAGGRLLRASPGKNHVTIQDHGGNWWRHGSLNADRHWELGLTESVAQGLRQERMRERKDPEPFLCPRCQQVLNRATCPCGFSMQTGKRSRPVVQADGTIREHTGELFPPRRTRKTPQTEDMWKSMYFRAKNSGMTFRQAEALFYREQGYWPPRDMKLMPRRDMDWFRKVSDVEHGRLTS